MIPKYHVAIDIGTNSILLLVAQKSDGSHPLLTTVLDQAQTVRLGENLLSTGRLSEQAMERTLNGLKTYLNTVKPLAPQRIICFGTEALRRAQNADAFCQHVHHKLGIKLQILSPAAEADYTFRGAISSLPSSMPFTQVLVIDIGGGSTEIVYGTKSTLEYQQSFPIGAVIAKEKFQLTEYILTTEAQALQTYTKVLCQPTPTLSQDAIILLTGGTATTLAGLDQQLIKYEIDAIDGYCMERSTIQTLYNQLNNMSLEQRTALPGMESGRADIILPALLILLTLLDVLNIHTVQISVRGARYGILL